ncbi:Acb2/Tad1 domain-containing protein [Anoxybacteroides rupiense]|uniref:Acb2/Tad1 domain-containing protein n=1 Tax=Anoxybacteroides rupiense TaxID=311460 RepID=UPI001F0A0341
MNPQIENNFRYHAPKEGQPEKYQAIREKAKELAYLMDELCPNSREKSLAFTNLEQSVMWANASIARNE